MARKRRAIKRKIDPDPRYNNQLIAKFINKVMLNGKKSLARRIVYDALESFAKKTNEENPLVALEKAFSNASPSLEVKSRRIGGATYQIPIEVQPERQVALVMLWIITHARNKPGKSMTEALALELADCYHNQGTTIKKKDDTHRMAEANKAFAHYK